MPDLRSTSVGPVVVGPGGPEAFMASRDKWRSEVKVATTSWWPSDQYDQIVAVSACSSDGSSGHSYYYGGGAAGYHHYHYPSSSGGVAGSSCQLHQTSKRISGASFSCRANSAPPDRQYYQVADFNNRPLPWAASAVNFEQPQNPNFR